MKQKRGYQYRRAELNYRKSRMTPVKSCCVSGCSGWAFYQVRKFGFCEKHKREAIETMRKLVAP